MSSTPAGSRAPLSAQADYIFGVSESLMKHPKFFAFLPEIVNYLQLSDKGWAFVLHARRDSHDSLILKESHPQLFRVPNDIINQVDTLRSGDMWNYYRHIVLGRFSERASHAQKLSLQIPEPQHRPTSYASTASSARSSLPPCSGSEQSARSSMSSGYISDWSAHDHHSTVSYSRSPWEAESSTRSVTPSPAVQRARKLVEPKKCPGCDKLYEKHGNLVRHLKVEHPDHPAAQKHTSKDFRDLPIRRSDAEEGSREVMLPPSMSSTNKATGGLAASLPGPDEKPLPPVPAKEGSKRPLPDSPTSQSGPRPATDPAIEAEAERQPYDAEAVVQDTWSDRFTIDLFEDIIGSLSSHDFDDPCQGMAFVE